MHASVTIGIQAAQAVGKMLTQTQLRMQGIDFTPEERISLKKSTLKAAQQVLIETIQEKFPKHRILFEGKPDKEAEFTTWVAEAVCGLDNFILGYPHFGVVLASYFKGRLENVVIYQPAMDLTFTASLSEGARLNSKKLSVSQARGLKGAVLSAYTDMALNQLQEKFDTKTRCSGALSLDLAYVAAGWLDGVVAINNHEPTAAARFLLKEAGGLFTNVALGEATLSKGNFVAGGHNIVTQLVPFLQKQGCRVDSE